MDDIVKWFSSLPGQGQATLIAAFVAGVLSIVGGFVEKHAKLFIAIAIIVSGAGIVAVALWAQKFDFATHTNYALMFTRGIQLEDDKDKLIDEAQAQVFFVGAAMHKTLGDRKDLLLERMQEGVHFRFLIADPDGVSFHANAEMFGQSDDELRAEVQETISGFRTVAQRWAKTQPDIAREKRGSISLRILDRVFPTGLYFFDPLTPRDMLIVPHGMGKDAPELPAYKIPAHYSRVIKNYLMQHEAAWASAKEVAPSP